MMIVLAHPALDCGDRFHSAAQTRMVSGRQLQPQQQELSQNLKYMARGRISEFESSHPSHAVGSSRAEIVASFPCPTSAHIHTAVTAGGGLSHERHSAYFGRPKANH